MTALFSVPPHGNALVPAGGQGVHETPGHCINLDYCSIGMHRQMVSVPIGKPFVCPECGNPLRPPGLRGLQRPVVLPALRILILCLGIVLGGVLGYQIGRPLPAPPVAAPLPARIVPPHAPALPSVIGPPETQAVRIRPFPAHPPAPDAADPAQHLAHEQRFGQIILDCVFIAARATASCHTGDVRGSDAFSSSATTWLRSLSPRYPAGADHRWRLIVEDFAGQAPAR